MPIDRYKAIVTREKDRSKNREVPLLLFRMLKTKKLKRNWGE